MLGSQFTQGVDVTDGYPLKNAVDIMDTGHVDFDLTCLVISNAGIFAGLQIN